MKIITDEASEISQKDWKKLNKLDKCEVKKDV